MADPNRQWDQLDTLMLCVKDPESTSPFPNGDHLPALTVLLFKVCDNDQVKFDEATRLIRLFMERARQP